MPSSIVVNLNAREQAQIRKQMRRLRLLCPLLRLHILLLLAQHRAPTEIADWLLCSRSSIYEIAACWRQGWRPEQLEGAEQTVSILPLAPSLRRSLPALLARPPAAEGWQRTRWSCATLVLSLRARRGIQISAETMRRWLHQLGWRRKRAKLAAPDNDPERVPKLARIRLIWETLRLCDVLLFADELDIPLLPKSGYQRMPQGTQVEVLTPGKNQKRHLAGAWDGRTGLLHPCCGLRKSNELFRNLLEILARRYPAGHYECVYVVVDNYKIHKAQAVQRWLTTQPRFHLLWLPTYCPRSNPIERIFGGMHDTITRNHKRKRLRDLVVDVERYFNQNGPWPYQLSALYQTPRITATLKRLRTTQQAA